jgi:hypothetical protein
MIFVLFYSFKVDVVRWFNAAIKIHNERIRFVMHSTTTKIAPVVVNIAAVIEELFRTIGGWLSSVIEILSVYNYLYRSSIFHLSVCSNNFVPIHKDMEEHMPIDPFHSCHPLGQNSSRF